VLSPINVAPSTSARHAVNERTPRGSRIFEYLLTNGARSTLDPRVGNTQSTQGKHASNELSPNGPPADRAWNVYEWGGPVTLRSWYSERISIQYHIKNTIRSRRDGAEWVQGGSNELWPWSCYYKLNISLTCTVVCPQKEKSWKLALIGWALRYNPDIHSHAYDGVGGRSMPHRNGTCYTPPSENHY
jgi:hypothetical protein